MRFGFFTLALLLARAPAHAADGPQCAAGTLQAELDGLQSELFGTPRELPVSLPPSGATVRTGGSLPKQLLIPADPKLDPYAAGSISIGAHPRPADYDFPIPAEVGTLGAEGLPARLEIPGTSEGVRLANELREQGIAHVRAAGSGSTSAAYFALDQAVPDAVSVANALDREIWLKTHATQVVKIVGHQNSQRKVSSLAVSLRRYFINLGLVRETAPFARYRDRPLIVLPKILSTVAEHGRGVIRMEVGRGPSVKMLQDSISCVLHAICREGLSAAEATQVMSWAKLDASDAQGYVDALVAYHHDTHGPTLMLNLRNGIPPATVKNFATNGASHPIGLDFFNGENWIWDPVRRAFMPIDL